jgi:outer membrane protein assembly factor BamA
MRLHVRLLTVVLVVWAAPALAQAQDQEPQTRAELLREEREEKSRELAPPERSGLERGLTLLENGRLLERLLNPAEGWYPKLGNVTAGSGFSFGPGYRHVGLLGGHADFSGFAIASFKKYWMLETRLRMPRLADGRVVLDAHAQRYEFPEEQYFGIGPDSRREDDVNFGMLNTMFGGSASYSPVRWLTFTGGLDRMNPSISASAAPGEILSLFSDDTAPGVGDQPDFLRFEASADVNYRQPKGNPRRGGRFLLAYQNYDDIGGSSYGFDRVEADVQQYIPFLNERRVIALRAFASVSDADTGQRIPFYLQRTLGGPDDLRGFRRFRFRDENMLLLQAEYRWEIFTAVDGALFYDAGKVASRSEDLNFRDLESDYGIGFRFGTRNGIFLRVEGAFGSSGGKHFVLRFGNVF